MVQVDPAERIAIGEDKPDSSAVKPMKCILDVPVCAPALRSVARGRLTAPRRNRNLGYAAIHFRLATEPTVGTPKARKERALRNALLGRCALCV